MDKRETALKLALEALEKYCTPYSDGTHPADEVITALRQAIEQAEKQEPVAWMDGYRNIYSLEEKAAGCEDAVIPLYTTPPPRQPEEFVCSTGLCHYRQPLTDEEINRLWVASETNISWNNFEIVARAIEAAHGIKGEA